MEAARQPGANSRGYPETVGRKESGGGGLRPPGDNLLRILELARFAACRCCLQLGEDSYVHLIIAYRLALQAAR